MGYNTNYYAWRGFVRTLASKSRLTVEYHPPEHFEGIGSSAYTKMDGSLHIPEPSANWSDAEFNHWIYLAFHESGHHMPERRAAVPLCVGNKHRNPLLGYIHNLVEDSQMERAFCSKHTYAASIMSSGRVGFINPILTKIEADPDGDQLSDALYVWETLSRPVWQPGMRDTASRGYGVVLRKYGADAFDLLDEFTERMMSKLDVAETNQLAHDIFDRLKEELGDDQPEHFEINSGEPEGQGGDEGEAGAKGAGKSEDGEGSAGVGAGEAAAGDAEDPDGQPGCSDSDITVKYRWLVADDGKREDGTAPQTLTDGLFRITYDPSTFDDPDTFEPDPEPLVYDLDDDDYPHRNHGNPGAAPSTLTRKFLRLLQADTTDKRQYNRKSGKLVGKNLYRLRIKGAGRDYKQRQFQQKVDRKTQRNIAVTVLCDASGSMKTKGKAAAAISAVTHMHEVLTSVGINTEIGAFSLHATHSKASHVLVQKFGKRVGNSEVEQRMRHIMPFRNGNQDGEAILWFGNRLLRQPQSRKVMIVLSDGQPVGYGGDIAAFTQYAVAAMHKHPATEIYGIGIMTNTIQHFYPDGFHAHIQHADQLEAALISVLKNAILRRQ